MAFVAQVNSPLRSAIFGENTRSVSFNGFIRAAHSMVCMAVLEWNQATYPPTLENPSALREETIEVTSTTLFLFAWLRSPHSAFTLLMRIAEEHKLHNPNATTEINSSKLEQGLQTSVNQQLCTRFDCPYPLIKTLDSSHSYLENFKKFTMDTLLIYASPWLGLTQIHNSTLPFCGHVCKSPVLSDAEMNTVSIANKVSGTISLVIMIAALGVLFLFRKRQAHIIEPLHLTIYMNLSLLPLVCLTLVSGIRETWRRIACFDDGVLRFNEPTSFNTCSISAGVLIFFYNLYSFMMPVMALKWYNLAKKVSSDTPKLRRGNTWSKWEVLLFAGGLGLSTTFTAIGLSRRDITGSPVAAPCSPSTWTFLYVCGIPFIISSAVALLALLFALHKILLRLNASREYRKVFNRSCTLLKSFQRPSVQSAASSNSFFNGLIKSIATHVDVRRTRRRSTTSSLRMLIKVFLIDIIIDLMIMVALSVNIVTSWAKSRDEERKIPEYLLCLGSSCRAEDCQTVTNSFPVMAVGTPVVLCLGIAASTLPVFFIYRRTYLAEISRLLRKLKGR